MKPTQDYKSRFKILKGGKIALVISALSTNLLMASPSGGVVTSGTANISQSGSVTNINQSTSKATINWNTFNIASNETVNFNQPNINSITLNRVTGNEKSIINGALNATGQVWLLNSNGVLFGKGAKINTSGLLATTKNISDTDFNNNNYILKGDSTNSVINLGSINIANSGYTTLLANSVTNKGTIKAIKGTIHLVGANQVTLNLNGNSMINLTIDKGVLNALVKNRGALYANAGEIYLTTNAVNELLKGVVNNSGIVEAQSIGDVTGKIELYAHGGEAQVGGTLKANDGFIETSGKSFSIADNTLVQTGNWLIDPTNVTIDSALASSLQTQLSSGNAQVTTASSHSDSGDINVNSTINWNKNTLTLHADNDININATLNATLTAGLALEYAQRTMTGTYNVKSPVNIASTGSFSTKKGLSGTKKTYYIITTLGTLTTAKNSSLQSISTTGLQLKPYILGANIDAVATKTWDSGKGFTPIGENSNFKFIQTFDGLGHTISNLFINRVSSSLAEGLFGFTQGATIKNIGLINANIKGEGKTGGLVGQLDQGVISNAYTTGTIHGNQYDTGGLVGTAINAKISNSYSTAVVTGSSGLGGLVGKASHTAISNSYAAGSIKLSLNNGMMGGLVANADLGTTISNSYVAGTVVGKVPLYHGGLVGDGHNSITIQNSFWDKQTTGITNGVGRSGNGGTGLTTDQMKANIFSTSTGSKKIWTRDPSNVKNSGYPYLTTSIKFSPIILGQTATNTKSNQKIDNIISSIENNSLLEYINKQQTIIQPSDYIMALQPESIKLPTDIMHFNDKEEQKN